MVPVADTNGKDVSLSGLLPKPVGTFGFWHYARAIKHRFGYFASIDVRQQHVGPAVLSQTF